MGRAACTRTYLLLPPPVTRVHLAVDAAPGIVEVPLWCVHEIILVGGLLQQPPGTPQDIPGVELDWRGVCSVPLHGGSVLAPGLVPQTIRHLVDALLDGVHRTHSVVYAEGW
jgi:hypothetical protein